ncbi:Protein YzbB, partial [hydrothermal vent metagenome]
SQLHLQWLLKAYRDLSEKHTFFNHYFDKLAGTDQLRKQIEAGFTEAQIRQSWQKGLKRFRKIRRKYLLYQ